MVLVTGGTGYMGRPLVERLAAKGRSVRVLARKGSESKVPAGAEAVSGYELADVDTVVHLVGVPRPSPWKGPQFRAVDLPLALECIRTARAAGVRHFVYVSVAHPAPIMRAYVEVRMECERALVASGMAYTILRPWYVLGPGHLWPHALRPLYAMAEFVPAWREGALRLGLVTHAQMISALEWAVENPSVGDRVMGVPEIRQAGKPAAR
ncbi:MAG: NAD(P)H-binding protein [Acidobacteriota bacterium]